MVLTEKNFKQKNLLQGPSVLELAKKALACVRKATSFLSSLVDEDGKPKESSKMIEDVVDEMLESMYQFLRGKQFVEAEDDGKEAESSDVEEEEDTPTTNHEVAANDSLPARKRDWMFHGYMSVLLFGPLAPKQDRLSFFFHDDPLPSDRKKYSRATARSEKRKDEIKERSIAVAAQDHSIAPKGSRGMSVLEKVQLRDIELKQASLALQLGKYDSQRSHQIVMALKFEAETLERKIDRAMRRAENTGKYDEVDRLEQELDTVRFTIAQNRLEATSSTQIGVKRCRDMLEDNDAGEVVVLEPPIPPATGGSVAASVTAGTTADRSEGTISTK